MVVSPTSPPAREELLMRDLRWRKLVRDLQATWGRVLAMQLAIAVALAGVGTVLATRAVLQREIAASYLATRPADATLELEGNVDDALLAEVRARPDIADADRRQMVQARVRTRPEAPWQMFVLFVVPDFGALRLATFQPGTGAWPPPRGRILVERTAVRVMGIASDTTSLSIQTPHGAAQTIGLAGTVHDAGQAPNWQEHRGVGYATLDTLAALGEPPILHELLVQFRPDPRSGDAVERSAGELARWLGEHGHRVHEVRVPKLRQHPHQGLMNASQLVLLGFSLMLLLLGAILMATILSAVLARQTREIGVMKAIGASSRQLAEMYVTLVLVLGAIAVAIAMPLAGLGAGRLVTAIAGMMNITLADPTTPPWVWAAIGALGLLVPLAVAAWPIGRAVRISVSKALAPGGGAAYPRMAAGLPIGLRNALRRPVRLAMTMLLLVIGGTFVLAAANVQLGLGRIAQEIETTRRYDLEVRMRDPVDAARIADLARARGITRLEAWQASEAALGTPEREVDIQHVYPDGGHGSFQLVAPPAGGSVLVDYPLLAGRWLVAADTDAVVLGNNAARGTNVGDRVTISVEGHRSTWRVVGIVREIGGGSAFVTAEAFARATGDAGVALLRFATTAATDADRAVILAALERTLAERDLAVRYAMPTPLLRSVIDDHVLLVIRAVIAMAMILALVGLVGLGSAMAINVAERTREIGVMKAIGASDRSIFRIVVGEAISVGIACEILATVLSLPLTAVVDAQIGVGFLARPPFAVSFPVMLGWLLAVIAGCVAASALPARRAARLSVRTALGEV
jgi:putative ABC transport system permease protein